MVSANNGNSFESSSAHDTAMPKTVEKSRHHNKSIAMKKYFLFLVFFCSISGLKSYSQESDFVIARNPDVTIQADDGTLIVASDVYSRKSALKRNIRLIHPKTNELIGEAFIMLESSDPDGNLYETIRENLGKFSGTLTIESGEVVIYRKQIVNGVADPAQVIAGRAAGELAGGPGPVYNPNLRCTLGNIHDCVSYRVEGLNWFQFALCLVSAPACYGRHWAFCSFDVCINHMQYTNPN